MTPEVPDRVAKLLRLACDRAATDGEKLAAISRVSAIVIAHDVDWDSVLNNVNGVQQVRPVHEWATCAGSAEAGADAERLKTILKAAAQARDNGLLSGWETQFASEEYGTRTYVSERQWSALDRLETKMCRFGIV